MKALVLAVRGRGKGKRAVIAVIPGIHPIEMRTLLSLVSAQKSRFPRADEAVELTG